MVPPEIEILDVCVEDDMSKMMFYTSDVPSKFYETETDLKMKLRDSAFEDYRKKFECSFDWKMLTRKVRFGILCNSTLNYFALFFQYWQF